MRSATTPTTIASVWLIVVASAFSVVSPAVAVDRTADTSALLRPVRESFTTGVLDPATRHIVVVGDSILYSHLAAGARPNQIVPLALAALDSRYRGTSVINLSFPGLSTLHAIAPQATTLRPYLTKMLDAGGPSPDVVVVAVSSIDINLFPDTAVTSLAPALVKELRAIENMLAARGIDTVFVPAFGINGDMYNDLRSRFAPFRDYRFDERVNEFNELLRTSGLPMLFHRFALLDQDDDGNADRRYFVGNDSLGKWPDDGIHPNVLGERVFGDNLANGLIAAFERG
jgi:lysophospholipase L1-like esterase